MHLMKFTRLNEIYIMYCIQYIEMDSGLTKFHDGKFELFSKVE